MDFKVFICMIPAVFLLACYLVSGIIAISMFFFQDYYNSLPKKKALFYRYFAVPLIFLCGPISFIIICRKDVDYPHEFWYHISDPFIRFKEHLSDLPSFYLWFMKKVGYSNHPFNNRNQQFTLDHINWDDFYARFSDSKIKHSKIKKVNWTKNGF